MTRLTWGSVGERFYEAGADRGVLFVSDNEGVPWNGLISVKETPDGGEPTPYYIDGLKYLNLATAEEFNATIEAFSSPEEFGVCDGTKSIHHGLFATQQPRKPFGLTYRTKIGNDIDGLGYAYKIHLVYNALAAPSDRDRVSIGSEIEPLTLSWPISTVPVPTDLFRPTAHFVIDSRVTSSHVLGVLEDTIYGNDTGQSRLPTLEELIVIFTEEEIPVELDEFTPEFEETF